MSELPILFNDAMVRAMRAGLKTQTRRPAKGINGAKGDLLDLSTFPGNPLDRMRLNAVGELIVDIQTQTTADDTEEHRFKSPYGGPGDHLWTREAWCTHRAWDRDPPRDVPETSPVWYVENHNGERFLSEPKLCPYDQQRPITGIDCRSGKWRRSIHMPRWASRDKLLVKRTWIERIRDIQCSDIRAEGVACPEHDFPGGICVSKCSSLQAAYRTLWDSIYAAKGLGWGENPWVWDCEFERISK